MKKIVNPCMCPTGRTQRSNAFVKIEYEDGRLSITGVIGPMSNGDCRGSAGQCVDEIRKGDPYTNEGWTAEMLKKLCDIWDHWHLNDMRPYCFHQGELGWAEKAGTYVKLYQYTLNSDALKRQKDAEKAAIDALKRGETFTPTTEQSEAARKEYFLTLHHEAGPEIMADYEPRKKYGGKGSNVEMKLLGHLRPDEHPEGILTKPCPVCGYKYGTAWLKEEVPQDVIDWLFSLPDSPRTPAWV